MWLYGFTDDEIKVFPGVTLEFTTRGALETSPRAVDGGFNLTDHATVVPLHFTAMVQVGGYVVPASGRSAAPPVTESEALALLERIRVARTENTVGLDGSQGTESLLLVNYEVTQKADNRGNAVVKVEFEQVKFATAVVSAVIPRRPRDRLRAARGAQTPEESPRPSLAAALYERFSGSRLNWSPVR